ncbi:hypothetical protein NC651_006575 [Populus alba x Populus x berolinensis]|nr:hypothetical protein NC651_006575 [Populus alba x Populus x berolinensis]
MKKSQELGVQCLRKNVSMQCFHPAIVSSFTDSHSRCVSLSGNLWTVIGSNKDFVQEHPPIFFPNCIIPIAKFLRNKILLCKLPLEKSRVFPFLLIFVRVYKSLLLYLIVVQSREFSSNFNCFNDNRDTGW